MSVELNVSIKQRYQMIRKLQISCSFEQYINEFNQNNFIQNSAISNLFKLKISNLFKDLSDFKFDEAFLNYPVLSFADHHGFLHYQLLYNSNILLQKLYSKLKFKSFIVLSVGNIPLNNISYPRGFYFKNKKFNFFPLRESKTPVSLFKGSLKFYDTSDISSLVNCNNKDVLTVEECNFLKCLFFKYLKIEEVSKNHDLFSDQITILNYRLWKLFFDKTIRNNIPDIVYLQSNDIINDIFISYIEDKNSLIFKILFDCSIRQIYLKNFHGIQGCWSDSAGSHFFIGLTGSRKIDSFKYNPHDNTLVGENNRIPLEKNIIVDLLLEKKISLTLFFDFLILSFLGGYTTLGGFNQIEYLPQMQEAHIKSLREIGENDLADDFALRITDGLICGMTPLKFDSSIDMIWHHNSTDGKFNGNLDRGLTNEDLEKIYNTPVNEMIMDAMETIQSIVK